jgi:hypothetical protein
MYPVSVVSPEFDGYSPTPIGRLEMLYGLQHTLDFLFNSQIANVRKSVNNMLVVDPYLVNIKDIEDGKEGALIRLRRPAWGRGVDKVVQQLAVQDITRGNIADTAYITEWMDRISGADQSMQGSLRRSGPERLTSAEYQGTRGSAISRLQRIARIIGTQFMQDIGTMFAVHSQQYMEQPSQIKIVGRNADTLRTIFPNSSARVDQSMLAVNYDLIVRDGSIPGGGFSNAWIELFKIIGQSETLSQQFDITKIFELIAYELGAKNMDEFRVAQPRTISDADAAAGAQAGNLVPVREVQ